LKLGQSQRRYLLIAVLIEVLGLVAGIYQSWLRHSLAGALTNVVLWFALDIAAFMYIRRAMHRTIASATEAERDT
jgi:hypothetical protein